MKHLSKINAIAVFIWMLTLFASLSAYAHDNTESKSSSGADRIVGVWNVQVTVANCAGGPPVATFPAMHKYEVGGTGQVVPGSNPALLSAHMMVWTRLGHNDYVSRFKMFRYDAAGNRLGWVVATNEVSINKKATEYTGSGVAEFFDNDGNFLMASCPTFSGTRFSAEP